MSIQDKGISYCAERSSFTRGLRDTNKDAGRRVHRREGHTLRDNAHFISPISKGRDEVPHALSLRKLALQQVALIQEQDHMDSLKELIGTHSLP